MFALKKLLRWSTGFFWKWGRQALETHWTDNIVSIWQMSSLGYDTCDRTSIDNLSQGICKLIKNRNNILLVSMTKVDDSVHLGNSV